MWASPHKVGGSVTVPRDVWVQGARRVGNPSHKGFRQCRGMALSVHRVHSGLSPSLSPSTFDVQLVSWPARCARAWRDTDPGVLKAKPRLTSSFPRVVILHDWTTMKFDSFVSPCLKFWRLQVHWLSEFGVDCLVVLFCMYVLVSRGGACAFWPCGRYHVEVIVYFCAKCYCVSHWMQ